MSCWLFRKLWGGETPEDCPSCDEDADCAFAEEENAPAAEGVSAQVLRVAHDFDPLRMIDATRLTFLLADGQEVTLTATGEGGLHALPGDRGLLTWNGSVLIAFEKDTGETIGGMYYIPAQEETDDE